MLCLGAQVFEEDVPGLRDWRTQESKGLEGHLGLEYRAEFREGSYETLPFPVFVGISKNPGERAFPYPLEHHPWVLCCSSRRTSVFTVLRVRVVSHISLWNGTWEEGEIHSFLCQC